MRGVRLPAAAAWSRSAALAASAPAGLSALALAHQLGTQLHPGGTRPTSTRIAGRLPAAAEDHGLEELLPPACMHACTSGTACHAGQGVCGWLAAGLKSQLRADLSVRPATLGCCQRQHCLACVLPAHTPTLHRCESACVLQRVNAASHATAQPRRATPLDLWPGAARRKPCRLRRMHI